jgi:hypothetical protein
MKLNYANFLLESKLYDLLLEARMEFKDDFKKVLKKVNHQIAKDLLDIVNKDIDININLFELGEKPDSIKFYNLNQLPKEDKYEIISWGQSYTAFTRLFRLAGVTSPRTLSNGTKGTVVKIWDYDNSNNIIDDPNLEIAQFVSDDGEVSFIGMNGLRKIEDGKKGSPQETKVGRLAQRILSKVDKKYTPKEVEEFVNKFKSAVELINNKERLFELVKGDDIAYWYLGDRYVKGHGSLQGSCMRYDSCQEYFSVYTKNEDKVSLLILKNEDDESKIEGRALIWKLDSGKTFMDRIYYTKDEQVEMFKEYARKNGWAFKVNQNIDYWRDVEFNGKIGPMIITVTLNVDFEQFPYMDTLRFLFKSKGIISNQVIIDNHSKDFELDNTDGWLSGCDTCNGEETVECSRCEGDGEVDCYECSGRGEIGCGECDGEGDIECSRCDGEGEIEGSDGEMEDCSYCNSGRIRCDECNGRGEHSCGECDGDGREECHECEGDGNVPCAECQ